MTSSPFGRVYFSYLISIPESVAVFACAPDCAWTNAALKIIAARQIAKRIQLRRIMYVRSHDGNLTRISCLRRAPARLPIVESYHRRWGMGVDYWRFEAMRGCHRQECRCRLFSPCLPRGEGVVCPR